MCLPKQEGGLGVINLNTQNEALLLKFLHMFFNKADIPWVNLVWENYYANGKLPGQHKKGSFWWRGIVKLLDKFKGLASAVVADGSTVLFWTDTWNDHLPSQDFPHLFSHAQNKLITFKEAKDTAALSQLFYLSLSEQAHQQLQVLQSWVEST